MPILTTDRGLAAIANADAGGFLVDLTDFAVTEAQGVELAIGDSSLLGAPVFSGKIQSIEVVSGSTVKVTLYIPPKFPTDGTLSLTELGLYLKTGEMFAHGTFKTVREKTSEYGLKIIVYVTAARLGNVINVTLSTNASLASSANVRSLIDPRISDVNAIVVQDGLPTSENVLAPTTGTLAIKYGAGGLNWAFLGHDLAYNGKPRSVVDLSTFLMNVQKEGGFWLNHNEVVIVQIVSGPGAGDSRRVKYNRDYIRFEVQEEAFSNLTADSILNVWRSTRHQLPYRSVNIDPNYVLGVGKNTWTKNEVANAVSSTDLIPKRLSIIGDGVSTSFAMAGVPSLLLFDKTRFLVWVGGFFLPQNAYAVSVERGLTIFTGAPANGLPIEIIYYTTTPSTGSALTFSVAEDVGDGATWAFSLSMIPKDLNYIMVFVNDILVPYTDYLYAGTSITFTKAAPGGNVKIICCGNFEELGAGTELHRVESAISYDSNGKINNIALDVDYVEKRNVQVYVAEQLISQDDFDISINQVEFNTQYPAGTSVSIVAFEGTLQAILVTGVDGENTGPVWVDPAGTFVPTNRIDAKRASYVGDGSRRSFLMNARTDKAIVFMDGLFQNPYNIGIDAENGILTLPDVLEAGREIDIISFESFPDEIGREVRCWRQNFNTVAGQLAYPIAAPAAGLDPQVTIISVGGVYAHASKYVQTPTSITFDAALPADMPVELWHYATVETLGSSCIASFGQFTLDSAKSQYVHAYYDAVDVADVGNVQNTLLFGSTVQQLQRDYTVDNSTAYQFIIPNVATAHSVLATSLVFFTGKSKTRLVSRAELNARYMTREQILALALGGNYGSPSNIATQATQMGPVVLEVTPTPTPVLSMIVNVPAAGKTLFVEATWASPGAHISDGSNYDGFENGQYWKLNTQYSEGVAFFRLTGQYGDVYNSSNTISLSIAPSHTQSSAHSAVFTNIPAGNYTLSLVLYKSMGLENHAVRSASMAIFGN